MESVFPSENTQAPVLEHKKTTNEIASMIQKINILTSESKVTDLLDNIQPILFKLIDFKHKQYREGIETEQLIRLLQSKLKESGIEDVISTDHHIKSQK